MRIRILVLTAAVIIGVMCQPGAIAQHKLIPGELSAGDEVSLFNGEDLTGWRVTQWTYAGPVEIEDNQLILNEGHECTGVTWDEEYFPRSNYEVTLDAMRMEGMDFFCGMTFPVRDEPCTLIIGGWGGSTVGLSSIDGLDAAENETGKLMQFDNKRWYRIRLRVTDESIQAWVDDEQIVDFTIGHHDLSIRMEVLWSKPFGICSFRTTAAIKNIQLKKI